ncbi:hypothetical protein BC829DRAFT_419532 [Chytridium lagenaria]|nr:hypothetical protein BC829DRAFT_419532 [Chytridium lagenaria]
MAGIMEFPESPCCPKHPNSCNHTCWSVMFHSTAANPATTYPGILASISAPGRGGRREGSFSTRIRDVGESEVSVELAGGRPGGSGGEELTTDKEGEVSKGYVHKGDEFGEGGSPTLESVGHKVFDGGFVGFQGMWEWGFRGVGGFNGIDGFDEEGVEVLMGGERGVDGTAKDDVAVCVGGADADMVEGTVFATGEKEFFRTPFAGTPLTASAAVCAEF